MISRLLLLLSAFFVIGAMEPPAKPLTLSPAEAAKEGRLLVAEILAQRPAQNSTSSGLLKIRDAKGKRAEIPVAFEIQATESNWLTLYEATPANGGNIGAKLKIIHSPGKPPEYLLENGTPKKFLGNEAMIPFAASDFWAADLGLEFFHWPEQRLLKKEIRRGQSCNVLESINPKPAPGSYSRVVSWIDIDSNGIIHADAYDHRNRLLKVFEPNEFKKVRGQWQLQEMEIRNTQTGSRTQIEFNLRSNQAGTP
jgi:hypothetical protein